MLEFKDALYRLIGLRIRKLRTGMGMKQEELAELSKVTRTSLSNIEAGKHQPSLHILYSIFQSLKSDVHVNLPTRTEVEEFIESENAELQLVDHLHKKTLTDKTKKDIEDIIKKL